MNIQDLPHLPASPGVYQFFAKSGKILYIGKAKNLSKRVRQYFSPGSVWKIDMVHQAHLVEYIQTRTEEEALLLEESLIKQYLPEYNRLLKHNSNYVWIKYTNEEFPQVMVVRKRKTDGATYIWPKQRSKRLYQAMKYLRRVFKHRTMPTTQFRKWVLDMDFHLWLDEWRSVIAKLDTQSKSTDRRVVADKHGIDSSLTTAQRSEIYQGRLDLLQQFLEWKTAMLLSQIEQEIATHAESGNFERCAQLRDVYQHIQLRDERYQSVVLTKPRTGKVCWITTLQNFYVVIIVVFADGKIVDVIREKTSTWDKDLTQLQLELEAEFELKRYQWPITNNHLVTSTGYIRLPKTDKTALSSLHQKFLDSYITSQVFDKESMMNDMLATLQERYQLRQIPYHMECIDISHMSGDRASGGLSCMINGLPSKKWYRQYKIREATWGDDYAALTEVIVRRFGLKKTKEIKNTNKSWQSNQQVSPNKGDGGIEWLDLPDLFILDGGKGQLGILRDIIAQYPVLEQIMQHTHFVALGKGDARTKKWRQAGAVEEIYWYDQHMEILSHKLIYDQTDRILTQLRDEAHRFANRYRKKQMSDEVK